MHEAVGSNESTEVIGFLLEHGIDIESKNNDGETPLLYAVHNTHKDERSFFDEEDVDEDDVDIIEYLINKMADKNAKDKNGNDMLHIAALNGNNNIAYYCFHYLHFSIYDTNNDGDNCIDFALKHSESETLYFFLDQMRMNQMNPACRYNKDEKVISSLCESKYPLNFYYSETKETILMSTARINKNPKVIDALVDNGADINLHDKNGRNFVHYAAANNSTEIYTWLLKDTRFAHLFGEKDNFDNTPAYYREYKEEF